MNPATFLRVLGPEPWNVAYVEPSIRPDDSRYGDNPNRLQRHTQFQVCVCECVYMCVCVCMCRGVGDDCRYRDNPYQAAAAHSVSVECVCVFVCMCVCVCMCRGVGDDCRYRDNPYRLQRHTQFQV